MTKGGANDVCASMQLAEKASPDNAERRVNWMDKRLAARREASLTGDALAPTQRTARQRRPSKRRTGKREGEETEQPGKGEEISARVRKEKGKNAWRRHRGPLSTRVKNENKEERPHYKRNNPTLATLKRLTSSRTRGLGRTAMDNGSSTAKKGRCRGELKRTATGHGKRNCRTLSGKHGKEPRPGYS